MVERLIQNAGTALTLAVAGFALWKGGRPEQIASLGNMAAVFASPWGHKLDGVQLPFWHVAAIDGAVLLLFCRLLLCGAGRRLWLYAACGVQLITVLIHVGVGLDVSILTRGYIGALNAIYFALLAILLAGNLEAWIRGDSSPVWPFRGRRAGTGGIVKPDDPLPR